MIADEEKASESVDSRSVRRGLRRESRTTVETFRLDFHAVEPVDVNVKDLVVQVDTTPPIWQYIPAGLRNRLTRAAMDQPLKTILDGVTARMRPGSLTAILGGSGSGKTSLLNVIAGRMRGSGVKISGSTTFNGQDDMDHIRSAYVMQQDVLIPTLTVRETLQYAADLRLPRPTTERERKVVVEQVILELGLKDCADTRIGSTAHKGCSGGEKRRASIGVQMLANPSVLFCDEPTTGNVLLDGMTGMSQGWATIC
jgi:ABC-type lipoprotein export system ATPase subunit